MSTQSERSSEDRTSYCFACSRSNPMSLGMEFWLQGDRCHGRFTPTPEHCGWTGVTHGGLLFTALDEVMANWLWLQSLYGFTAHSEVRFRELVPTGTALKLEAWKTGGRNRLVMLGAEVRRTDTGALAADCEAKFMLRTG